MPISNGLNYLDESQATIISDSNNVNGVSVAETQKSMGVHVNAASSVYKKVYTKVKYKSWYKSWHKSWYKYHGKWKYKWKYTWKYTWKYKWVVTYKKVTTSSSTTSSSSKVSSSSTSSNSSTTTNTSSSSSLTKYLKATTNCQSTSTTIKSKAKSITSGKTSSYTKAVAVYTYVRDKIGYSFYYNTKYGAVGTLSKKTGNCCDTAHLLVALSRASGIPARYVHGYCKFSSGSWYGHVWAEVYVNGKWYKADATSYRNSFGVVNNWKTSTATIYGKYASLPF
ncbi:MAG TPA: transglutaminase-like domain-containing protein [Methanobacterium sp.]|nr:transglutaminase-like domain-containing protein [Methanobacterium sp.]